VRALIVGVLAIIAFVVMYFVGSAVGGAWRGGTAGAAQQARDVGVGMSAPRTPVAPGFAEAPGSLRAGPGPHPTNERPSFASVSRALAGATRPTATPAGGQQRWRQVTYWAGRGDRDTEAFVVRTAEWRLNWSARNEQSPGAGTFAVAVYDDQHALVGRVVDAKGPGADANVVRGGAGRYYLKITSAALDWHVAVEEPR
jgi:hypothetical protein